MVRVFFIRLGSRRIAAVVRRPAIVYRGGRIGEVVSMSVLRVKLGGGSKPLHFVR